MEIPIQALHTTTAKVTIAALVIQAMLAVDNTTGISKVTISKALTAMVVTSGARHTNS